MIQIEIQSADVMGAIEQLHRKIGNLSEPMGDIGNYLMNMTEESFDNERSPDGEAWHPLAESTLRYKAKYGGHKILQSKDSNTVRSLSHDASDTSVIVGVNAYSSKGYEYPIAHQFGTDKAGRSKSVRIEARPFFPITQDGELVDNVKVEVLEIIMGYLEG
ncbi:MAG: phage virion morphogenesis protein [Sulfuricurvum sp.]|nr:phage virion morphogenesis protein [Sulfuricurvum sp.]